MKTKIIGALLLGCVISVYADAPSAAMAPASTNPAVVANTVMVASNSVAGPSKVNMTVIQRVGMNPQVQIDVGAPATLTVYDQNHQVAFTETLNIGRTIVDTTNFPLGNDQLVVNSNQTGVNFTMVQNVTVQAPEANS